MSWYWNFINWLEAHQGSCMYKKFLGVKCPGCGMQRSFVALLRGNVWESLTLFPALIPLLCMFAFLALHLIFKYKNGAKILTWWFIINVLIIVISYLVKMIQH